MGISDKIKEYFAPSPEGVRARDVVRELPGGVAKLGQASLRVTAPVVTGLGRMGQRIQAALDPKNTYADYAQKRTFDDITPRNDFEKNLFGTDETLSFRTAAEEIGMNKDSAFAPFIGFGLGVAELTPGGSSAKNALGLADESVDIILKSKNVNRITQILKGSGKIIAPEVENTAKALKNVSTVADFNKVMDGLKERGFIKSVREILPAGASPKLGSLYAARSTEELGMAAKNLIKDDIDVAAELAMKGTDERAVAVAAELIKKYSDDALRATSKTEADMLYDKVAEIANTMAPKLTELGRAVQAASLLARMTPEGQIRFAAKTIENWNRFNPKRAIPGLTGQEVADLTAEAKRVFAMPDGIEKARAYQAMQEGILDRVPTPLLKKLTTVWKAGLLTGIKTTGLNIFSNTTHFALEALKDIPAAAVDNVASLFTGKRTTTATLRGTAKGMKEGFSKGWDYWRTGFDERNIGEKLDYKRISFGKGKVAKLFQTYTDTVFRTIGAQDQPFYYGSLARSLHDQALAQAKTMGLSGKKAVAYAEDLVSNPTEEMLTAATIDATTAVFQNRTVLGELGEAVRRVPEHANIKKIIGDKAVGAAELVMPFVRTPASVAMQIINYSPIGAVKTLVSNIGKGKFNQRAFSQGLGRATVGTVPMYIGYKLAADDRVSFGYPKTDSERDVWEAEGRKDNSILIDGKWREPGVLGPAGNLIMLGAYYQKALRDVASPSLGMYEGIKSALAGGFSAFKEQTFLTGINSFVNAFNDPERFGEAYLAGLVASTVPTIISDTSKALDPLERRSENIAERVQSRIPIARERLEPRVDILGREIPSYGSSLDIMINPTRPQESRTTPVIKEIVRLSEAGLNVRPTKLGDKEGFKTLTQEQNTLLWRRTGQILDAKLQGLMAHPAYAKADDSERAKAIKDITEQVKVLTRAEFIADITAGLSQTELMARIKEIRQSEPELLNQDVYREFLRIR